MFVQHFRRRLHSVEGAMIEEETGLLINAMDYTRMAPVNALPSQRFKDVTPYWCVHDAFIYIYILLLLLLYIYIYILLLLLLYICIIRPV